MKSLWSYVIKGSASFAVFSLISFSTTVNSAQAITVKECREQYNAAKKAGNVNEKNFNDYRTVHCMDKKDPTAAAAAHGQTKDPVGKPSVKKGEDLANNTDVVFPNKIDAKYSNEKEGTARRKTCLDQYNLNKQSGKNGHLKWIQKGGGYYSECVKRLKNEK